MKRVCPNLVVVRLWVNYYDKQNSCEPTCHTVTLSRNYSKISQEITVDYKYRIFSTFLLDISFYKAIRISWSNSLICDRDCSNVQCQSIEWQVCRDLDLFSSTLVSREWSNRKKKKIVKIHTLAFLFDHSSNWSYFQKSISKTVSQAADPICLTKSGVYPLS